MTSPERRRLLSRATRSAVAGILVLLLAGCGLGQPQTFIGRSEKGCRAITASLARQTPVTDPVSYAIDRYGLVDHLLVTVTTDTGFPGGPAGQSLRTAWITPSRAALAAGRPNLAALDHAVSQGRARRAAVFARAARIGDHGVSTATLRRLGLPECAQLFAARAPALAR